MSHFLLPSTPIYGHVAPMLTIGQGLAARGHRVSVLTGRKYRSAVESHGLAFLPLPAEVDYDDADLSAWLPGRERYKGIAAGRHDILGMFVRPLRSQHEALTAALTADRYDGVVCECAFLGVLPTLLTVPAVARVPVVGVSVTPMSLMSVDCAPFGSGLLPRDSPWTRLRNRQINYLLYRGPLRPVQDALDAELMALGAPPGEVHLSDQVTKFDLTFHLAVAGFEYPRRELPASIVFVGPLRPGPCFGVDLPSWWADLDGSRPVVHVTQGTIDNAKLGKLVIPALRALAAQDVLVVASTGGRPLSAVLGELGGPLPRNARLAEFLPYDELLTRTDVMVTNGGFGGVQRALSAGVPLVVAGATEDKPEVAARVAWSGTGINLRDGAPSPGQLRRAVGSVLTDQRYRRAARRLQREIAAHGDPLAKIVDTLESLTSGGLDPAELAGPCDERLSLGASGTFARTASPQHPMEWN